LLTGHSVPRKIRTTAFLLFHSAGACFCPLLSTRAKSLTVPSSSGPAEQREGRRSSEIIKKEAQAGRLIGYLQLDFGDGWESNPLGPVLAGPACFEGGGGCRATLRSPSGMHADPGPACIRDGSYYFF
jgi:hypothetical protein